MKASGLVHSSHLLALRVILTTPSTGDACCSYYLCWVSCWLVFRKTNLTSFFCYRERQTLGNIPNSKMIYSNREKSQELILLIILRPFKTTFHLFLNYFLGTSNGPSIGCSSPGLAFTPPARSRDSVATSSLRLKWTPNGPSDSPQGSTTKSSLETGLISCLVFWWVWERWSNIIQVVCPLAADWTRYPQISHNK